MAKTKKITKAIKKVAPLTKYKVTLCSKSIISVEVTTTDISTALARAIEEIKPEGEIWGVNIDSWR